MDESQVHAAVEAMEAAYDALTKAARATAPLGLSFELTLTGPNFSKVLSCGPDGMYVVPV